MHLFRRSKPPAGECHPDAILTLRSGTRSVPRLEGSIRDVWASSFETALRASSGWGWML